MIIHSTRPNGVKRYGFQFMTPEEKKVFKCWKSMKNRCYAPNTTPFAWYGGRGIKVCDRWLESFENFLEDMGLPPDPSLSLDRRDSNKDYCKDNCHWATDQEQMRNTRRNRHVTINGVTKTPSEWADQAGIRRATFCVRMRLGWTGERLLTAPWTKKPKVVPLITINGIARTMSEWAKELEVKESTLRYRLSRGCPPEKLSVKAWQTHLLANFPSNPS
jgi:hypothetical protein